MDRLYICREGWEEIERDELRNTAREKRIFSLKKKNEERKIILTQSNIGSQLAVAAQDESK